ncbi:hypothetical protein AAFF_G00411940 [Aldrovandia affinis]|uniref:RNA pseudouridylate synthase domain-containing protein 2 n=1 Tax=Aldrovandia affinis TaxID=143900 RepID=A0AAD7SBC9_9TELE|nr:hypothetical protein AAFF_G00411940 [Aldrovandia affinis]
MHVNYYEKLSAVVVSQIRGFKYVKHNISNLFYDQKCVYIGKNNTIREPIYTDRTKVNTRAKYICLKLKNNCFSNSSSENTFEYNRSFRQYHTIVESVEMEANEPDVSETLIESKAVTASVLVDHAVKDKGEKRKSEEIEVPDKRQDGKKRRGPRGAKKLRPGERYVPPPKKLKAGVSFSQEHFQETAYYFEGGLRKVYPYYFDYQTYCKGRWIGKSLREVFSSEFRVEPLDFYNRAAKHGRIRLNETPVEDLDVILKDNDLMRNTVHRHEPPVTARPLKILEDNGEVVVVDKPASLPVHPCGRFRHNTVIFILGKERGLTGLHTSVTES